MTLAGSGIAETVEKLPAFCAVKLVKLAPPLCDGVILTNASDAAPGTGPVPMMGVRLILLDWRVTMVGLPPFVVPLEASKPPEAPFAITRPFVIVTVRITVPKPALCGNEEMIICPLKPFWTPEVTADAALVSPAVPPPVFRKVSNAADWGPERFDEFPICEIVIGIEAPDTTPAEAKVVGFPGVNTTWSTLACCENDRMVAALADVDIASDATHTAANSVKRERMVLLLPL